MRHINFIETLEHEELIIAFVGAGGKTTTIFSLAKYFFNQGKRVGITTTTNIFDPRQEEDKTGKYSEVILEPFEEHAAYKTSSGPVVLAQQVTPPKLKGIPSQRVGMLSKLFDIVFVEADGAKQRLVKAPASWEPVVPASSDIVVGVIGAKCLGRPMDARIVFRPKTFESVTTCRAGEKITPQHLLELIRHKKGLFKGAPQCSKKVVLLVGLEDMETLLFLVDNIPNDINLSTLKG